MDLNVPRRLKLSVRRTEDRAEATGATEGPGTDNFLSTLKARLAATEYPDEIESAGWGYGIDTKTVKMLTQEWLHHYNWEEQLEHLNRDFEHWTCRVNGLDIHYSKANEKGEVIMPLLLIHGWPGSWYEFGKAIQLLKKRGRFQIIVPSLPGYGWSQAPSQKKFGVREIAKTLHELMQYLGYKYYLAQGGDWGAIITRTLATLYPDSCLAIHINMLPCLPPRPWTRPFQSLKAATGFLFPSLIYRNHPREQASVEALKAYAIEEGAYFFIQATKPQTLGHALHDSPVGLLSWLGEKYLSWADLDPHKPETWPFSKTELLTQIMIYHSTGTITSSTRIYYEAHHNKDVEWMLKSPVPHRVPVGVGVWNKELFMVPKAWADDWMNIQSWHEFPKGGHFAAFERPVEFEKEITEFFTKEQVLDRFSAKRLGLKI
ncbi:Alpha/Beta hydrolase protein [Lobosporangium transversale]|uniref:Alpha/Beta hydrolase protein n=1 Tax=Lobosporangium transversale TaxID=64571 RepID=A0A1Y2GVF2_9FUNG|nr:Alpha/Beta hydrolase protein [Lobosporangium transversale]ORZ26278.1 Alpha/Beta hydrolase protein [Lobosporangium transversale]|eukprot:XP_021884043.1 Alpha/Beta hydrolase protein [Lobosporangium transversale]